LLAKLPGAIADSVAGNLAFYKALLEEGYRPPAIAKYPMKLAVQSFF